MDKDHQYGFRLPKETVEKLRRIAKKQHRSIAGTIRVALDDYIDAHPMDEDDDEVE